MLAKKAREEDFAAAEHDEGRHIQLTPAAWLVPSIVLGAIIWVMIGVRIARLIGD